MKPQLCMALLLLADATLAHAGAVVAGKDSPLGAMDAAQVKKVFLGHEPQLAGQSVIVVYQKDGAVRAEFEAKVLGKSGAELTAYWSKLIFTGKAAAPEEVAGDAGVKARLGGSPGAVGYLSEAAVDGSVKVLFRY